VLALLSCSLCSSLHGGSVWRLCHLLYYKDSCVFQSSLATIFTIMATQPAPEPLWRCLTLFSCLQAAAPVPAESSEEESSEEESSDEEVSMIRQLCAAATVHATMQGSRSLLPHAPSRHPEETADGLQSA